MHPMIKKQIASYVWPRFSRSFDAVNRSAQLLATIRRDERTAIRKFASRKELHSAVNEIAGDVPITLLEFGVWRGNNLRHWVDLNTNPESRFYGFDSFEGMPEDWHHSFGNVTDMKEFDVGGVMPSFDDGRVALCKGWFQHTLHGFVSRTKLQHPIIVDIDSDLYSSALYVLCTLDPILEAGDIIMFDEYSSPLNEYLAWEQYKQAFMRKAKCIGMSSQWMQAAFVVE
jgi:hypothetical protein